MPIKYFEMKFCEYWYDLKNITCVISGSPMSYILTRIIGVFKNWNLFTFIINYIVLKNVGLDHVKREATLGI